LFSIVDREYANTPNRFSSELLSGIKHMMGEAVHEISEGLNNGLDDYRIIFQHNSTSLLNKTVGPEFAQLASMMLSEVLWT